MSQPASTAAGPISAPAPTVVGKAGLCSPPTERMTAPGMTTAPSPTVIGGPELASTAPTSTTQCSSSTTLPTTCAPGATRAVAATTGERPIRIAIMSVILVPLPPDQPPDRLRDGGEQAIRPRRALPLCRGHRRNRHRRGRAVLRLSRDHDRHSGAGGGQGGPPRQPPAR